MINLKKISFWTFVNGCSQKSSGVQQPSPAAAIPEATNIFSSSSSRCTTTPFLFITTFIATLSVIWRSRHLNWSIVSATVSSLCSSYLSLLLPAIASEGFQMARITKFCSYRTLVASGLHSSLDGFYVENGIERKDSDKS